MQFLILLTSLFLALSCPTYPSTYTCWDIACKTSGRVCNSANGCVNYICDGCKGSFGCLINIDPFLLPACTNVTSCSAVSTTDCSCSASSNCGKYTCPTICSGTGIVDGGKCSSTEKNTTNCNSGIWTQMRTCNDVQQNCAGSICNSGQYTYGKYQCTSNGCSGWYCPNPPCIQDQRCPDLKLDINEPNFCLSLNNYCNSYSLGDLIYSSVTEKGGSYQCFRCSNAYMGTVNVIDQSIHEDSRINSGMAVLYFILGFVGGSGLIFLAAYLMNKHYNPPKKGPKKSCRESIQYWFGWFKNKGAGLITDELFGGIRSENLKYHFINNHELFAMTCLSDPLEHNRVLNIRYNIAKLMISVALSFVFCGIDVSNSVKRNTCTFEGRNGFTSSQNIFEKGEKLTIELPTINYSITLLVFFLKSVLILPSISYLKGHVFSNLKLADKSKRFFLYSFALIIEIAWIIILVSCIEAEKTITSTAKLPDKFTLYFQTVAIVAAMDWVGWNNIKIVISYFLNKKFGKKKYEPTAISSPGVSSPAPADPTTVV